MSPFFQKLLFCGVLVVFVCSFFLIAQKVSAAHSEAEYHKQKYWIYFKDRGFSDLKQRDKALLRERMSVSPRVAWRRHKTMGDTIVTINDLPLCQKYLEALQTHTISIVHQSRWLNAVSTYLSPHQLRMVEKLPFVARICPVKRFRRIPLPRIAPLGQSSQHYNSASFLSRSDMFELPYDYGSSFTQLSQINVTGAHFLGFTGAGVIIAMLDTGYRTTHRAFQSANIIGEWDFINNDGDTMNDSDDAPGQHDHGTATFSTCGGFMPGELIGPAFGAAFLLAKTEDIRSELPIEEDNWIAALEWAELNGADVVSSSLAYLTFDDGTGYSYEDLDGATAAISIAAGMAAERAVLVVNAMGNEGPEEGTLDAPADAFNMLACGAVDSIGQIASFSSRGPTSDGRIKPEVVAQGINTHCANATDDHSYYNLNGTSLSTPLVAGAAALVIQNNQDLTPVQVRQLLLQTASRWNQPDNTYGYGIIDTVAAIYAFPAGVNPTDQNSSGRVDGLDLLAFSHAFGSTSENGSFPQQLDIDHNGIIDETDLRVLTIYFGRMLN